MSNFKWTDEKLRKYVTEHAEGYKLLHIERGVFKGKIRLFMECEKGHEYDANFDNFQKGKRCTHCFGKIKFTIEQVRNFIEIESDSNCILLSDEYTGIDDKLLIECPCANEFPTTFYNFKYNNKRRCNECRYNELSERFRNPIEYVAEKIHLLSNGNCTLLSTEYKNSKTPMELLCGCGNTFDVKYCDFLSNKQYQCPDCGFRKRVESKTFTFEYVKNDIESYNYRLLEPIYITSDLPLYVECPEGHKSHIIYNNFRRGARCQQCYFDNMGGENHYAWKGGISSLHEYLRHNITEWKKDSMKESNYKCVVTGEKFDVIHHLYSFNKIIEEVIEETSIPLLENIGSYTEEELSILRDKNIELHYKYGLGVCLTYSVHYLFHNKYGKEFNTHEQFYEFTERYRNGEFKEVS